MGLLYEPEHVQVPEKQIQNQKRGIIPIERGVSQPRKWSLSRSSFTTDREEEQGKLLKAEQSTWAPFRFPQASLWAGP